MMHNVTLIAAANAGASALGAFSLYIVGVFVLAWLSSRMQKGKGFVSEYFLGNRGFGMWAFALTFAATAASGGTFMGFPAKIYSHGWVLALWIAGYMVVPLVAMGAMGKRLNHVARKANAVTLPEVLEARLQNRSVGLVATVMIIFFMYFYLLAQFKAGSEILARLLGDVPAFQQAVGTTRDLLRSVPVEAIASADPAYVCCLVCFAVAVIVYVVYGGFRAVVWTDVMQGIIMFAGVLIMFGLVMAQTGGLTRATRTLEKMSPPDSATLTLTGIDAAATDQTFVKGMWFELTADEWIKVVATPELSAEGSSWQAQVLIYRQVDGTALPPIVELPAAVAAELSARSRYASGADSRGAYLKAPGPHSSNAAGFLSLTVAISFFFFWPFGTMAQPSNMVRLMAFNNTRTLRRSIVMISVYFTVIYFLMVVIFCAGRVLLPGMDDQADGVMPALATTLTSNAGVPWLAGVLLAAPFAAVMSSVDSFLLMVSSAVVRDIYQNRMRPSASERSLRWLSYFVTALIGVAAMLSVIKPPRHLQDLIVFASGGLAGCFLIPVLLMLFWKRMTGSGAIAGMLGGFLMHTGLLVSGYLATGEFRVLSPFNIEPLIWDLLLSGVLAFGVSFMSRPPTEEVIDAYFYSTE
ncbi:MAG: sodium/pantothenate symporter [Verrucomicrobiales bacterium]|jgi:sodium/pantothenate symporter